MISELSYENIRDSAIEQYKELYIKPLSGFKAVGVIPTALPDLLNYNKMLVNRISQLKSIKIPPVVIDINTPVNEYFDSKEELSSKLEKKIKEDIESKRRALNESHETEVREANIYNESLIQPLREKHMELLGYKDDLSYVFEHYDITPLDMELSDNLTIEEFSLLIDESISTCLKYIKKDSELFNRILSPLEGESNLAFTAGYTAVILCVSYLLLPIVAVPAFVLLFLSVHNLYKDLEKLRIASALMSQIDYNRFVPDSDFKKVDDLDLTTLDAEVEEKLKNIEHYDRERKALLEEFNCLLEVDNTISKTQELVMSEYDKIISGLAELQKKVQGKIDNIMENYKQFPEVQNNSVVMSHSYVLGRVDNTIDVPVEFPLLNMVFNSENRDEAIKTMKLYLANALLSVRVKHLTIEIYDPINMCADFTEFFTPETKPYIKPNNMKLDDLLSTYKQYSQTNIIELDKKTIDEFNKEAEEAELVPIGYKLLLFVSDLKKLKEKDNKDVFGEYFKFSASSGVMIWLLDSERWANSIWISGDYSGEGSKIEYTQHIGRKAVSTYCDALRGYKDSGIDYVEKFGNVFLPREKWWTFDTIKGINMPYGLENGDPTRGLNVCPVIGDANVHSLLGGATGAGKSAAINQLLISLITMYPPSELMLVYIDFKNVEAAKFTAGFDKVENRWMESSEEKSLRENDIYYTRLSRIPHLHIISGTTDGEYALSVFEFLMNEMARRQEIINKFGVTKVQEMREQILSSYNKEHNGDPKKGTWAEMRKDWDWYKPNVYDKYGDLPRLLVIFDEFQVMYNPEFVDSRIIDTINGKVTAITKLARAMGAHFWFTSQSMKGTMSKDTMSNFSLRGALRCTKEVSDELLGNPAAGLITQKFGFMYTNDSAGTDPNANRKWRVPFLDEKDMPMYIDQLNDMLDEFNEKHRMAEFYDERILVPSSVLDVWYESYPDTFKDPRTFILGERANYSVNKAPTHMTLQQDGGENIMMAAFDRTDMLNLVLTMIDNLKYKNDSCSILMNVQDTETHTLLDVENIVDEAFLEMSYPKFDIETLIDNFDTMISNREENPGDYKPVYIFLVQWERAPGISVDQNYKMGDRFKDMLRKAPNFGIHFIFASRERLDMPRFIPAACNHRIAGLLPKDSMHFIETPKVEKLPNALSNCGLFAFYEFGTQLTKFRIYQHKFTKTIKSREIVL